MEPHFEDKLQAVAQRTLAGKDPYGCIATSITYAREIIRLRALVDVSKVLQ